MHEHSQFASLEPFPSSFLSRPFHIVAPTAIVSMGVRTHFFRVIQQVIEFRPMILGGGIVVDESRLLGSLILVLPKTSARLPLSLECKLILHHLLILRPPEVWRSHPELWRLSCVKRRIPAL